MEIFATQFVVPGDRFDWVNEINAVYKEKRQWRIADRMLHLYSVLGVLLGKNR